jgi:hypothetical protein
MKTMETEIQLHTFLISALNGGEWSASRLGRFNHGKKLPVPIRQVARLAPELVWARWRTKRSLPLYSFLRIRKESESYDHSISRISLREDIFSYGYLSENS